MAVRPRTNGAKSMRMASWNADDVPGRKLEHFVSDHGVDICPMNETHFESDLALMHGNCLLTDGPPDSVCRTWRPLPLCDKIPDARSGLPLAHTTLDAVGSDREPERRIHRLDGGRSYHNAHGLEFLADHSQRFAPAWLSQQNLLLDLRSELRLYSARITYLSWSTPLVFFPYKICWTAPTSREWTGLHSKLAFMRDSPGMSR
jgi:hypothetical protein